jgi:hypothetical protein
MPCRSLTITATLVLFFCTPTRAQFQLGIDAGPDFARILNIIQGYTTTGEPYMKDYHQVTHLYCGVHADIPLDRKDKFILRPALRYLGAGGETPAIPDYYGGNSITYPSTNWSFHYLNLPVQALYSPSFKFGKPWIGGGFYSNVLLSGNGRTNQNTYSLGIGNSAGDIKRFDFGFVASVGFIFRCGVLIGGDFQQSLTGIDPENSFNYAGRKVRNSVWGVYLGYTWTLKRKSH